MIRKSVNGSEPVCHWAGRVTTTACHATIVICPVAIANRVCRGWHTTSHCRETLWGMVLQVWASLSACGLLMPEIDTRLLPGKVKKFDLARRTPLGEPLVQFGVNTTADRYAKSSRVGGPEAVLLLPPGFTRAKSNFCFLLHCGVNRATERSLSNDRWQI